MFDEAPAARHARYRQVARELRGGDLFDQLVRLSVIYAERAGREQHSAKLAEMTDFVKTAARIRGEDNGVRFAESDLCDIAGAVEADARVFLASMPAEGGRA